MVRGGPLYLAFGPVDAKLEETEGPKVGKLIQAELERQEFPVEWEGTFNSRIKILELNWQRRHPPESPVGDW